MVRRKSQTAAEIDILVNKAVLKVQSQLYKSLYKTAKKLRVSKDSVICHVNRSLSHSQTRQQQ